MHQKVSSKKVISDNFDLLNRMTFTVYARNVCWEITEIPQLKIKF